ncbi:MAG: DUF1127 domain-containing protein [Tropicimonas sp.]|uniref:DUF1127 domain-containing protein n=1 Tax=Tropicimonas sp. TaxID=2067044 RepID=UPI003A84274F
MATTLNTVAPAAPLPAPFATLRARFQRYMLYRQSVAELSSLSDRALADLGLSRGMIKSVSHEAAYGL